MLLVAYYQSMSHLLKGQIVLPLKVIIQCPCMLFTNYEIHFPQLKHPLCHCVIPLLLLPCQNSFLKLAVNDASTHKIKQNTPALQLTLNVV